MTIVVIDGRELYRECLASALTAKRDDWTAVTVSNVAEWLKTAPHEPEPAVILFCIGNDSAADLHDQLEQLRQAEPVPPVALLAQKQDTDQVVAALNLGVRAYIPTNATLDVVVQALDLVRLGGVFLPASCLSSLRDMLTEHAIVHANGTFTAREYAVLESLRQGRSNKSIAYDLDMSESTVKVHIRNIMRKLKASNRTEVVFLTQGMFNVSHVARPNGGIEH